MVFFNKEQPILALPIKFELFIVENLRQEALTFRREVSFCTSNCRIYGELIHAFTSIRMNCFDKEIYEFDVITMASYASIGTTRLFYLTVHSDLSDRARKASFAALGAIFNVKLLQVSYGVKIIVVPK